MTCQQVMSLTQAFGDGELDAESRRRFVEHVRSCGACRLAYDGRRQLVGNLAAALSSEAVAPARLAETVSARLAREETAARNPLPAMGRLVRTRSFRIAFSAAGALAIIFAICWFLFGQDLALAKAIDNALLHVKSAHFVALEGGRQIEVWATQDAERVSSGDGWMVAKDGLAYLFDAKKRRVSIRRGEIAHLDMLRGLNVFLLSERLRGRVLGKPLVVKEYLRLPDGKTALRISASGKLRHYGVTCDFDGSVLVDPDTHLILSGEASETIPDTPQAKALVRQGKLRGMRIHVDHVDYNVPVPKGTLDVSIPKGWKLVEPENLGLSPEALRER